ncbi:MAG: DUF4135 domain-containing protein [Eubacteriales bacterium]|nr:DUF4135 domain-containing protein [Eubacteriales bacterium]
MNELFTEEEIRDIFDRSLIPGAYPENYEAEYEEFSFWLKYLLASSECSKESEFVFGKPEAVSPAGILFGFMFNPVRRFFKDRVDTKRYLPGAYSEWQVSFCTALSDLFGIFLIGELQLFAGPMTSPSTKWAKESAMPFIKDGTVLRSMAEKYPLFIRQTVTFTWLQIRHLEEVMDAIQNELGTAFYRIFGVCDIPKIKNVNASKSDRHNGGKSVHIIEFEDGRKIVYKPHHADIDRAFEAWTGFIAQKGGERPYLLPVSVDTSEGSFVQFIEGVAIENREDAGEYYRRMGFLMGSIYLLRGHDLHMENIIAVGKEPVIIDLETMVVPKGCLNYRMMNGNDQYSVLSMALLPSVLMLPGFKSSPFSGLCDLMNGSKNLPVYDGTPISGREHIEELCSGFEKALKTVMAHKDEATEFAANVFKGTKVRMVLRPTQYYGRMLAGLASKKCLGDLTYYRSLIDRKKINENELLTKEECLWIMHEEQKALEILDIPFFEDTLTEKMVRDMCSEWNELDSDLISKETARIRFVLSGIRPDSGRAKEQFIPDDISLDRQGLRELSHICAKMLTLSVNGTAVTREQLQVYLSDMPLHAYALLDGNLGSLVALGAYKKLFGSDEEIENGIREGISHVLDPLCVASALVPSAMGFADGTAGYIIGMKMCHEMGLISEESFREALEKAGRLADDPTRIAYMEPAVLYGSIDMIYALSGLPEGYMTKELIKLKKLIQNSILNWSEYKCLEEADLVRATEEALYPHCSDTEGMEQFLKPCKNNSLRMGNSGKLYAATNALQSNEDETLRRKADILCAYLSTQCHIYENAGLPEDCFEAGLLHGVPGILYSICRYLRPDLIPPVG